MKFITAKTWWSLLGISSLKATNAATHLRRNLQVATNTLDPGFDRVDDVDRTFAECKAENGATGTVEWTEVKFFYAIHATSAVDQGKEQALEDLTFFLIQSAILWCTLPEQAGIDLGDGGRKLRELLKSTEFRDFQRHHRKLSIDESRRLSIIAFNNNPIDQNIDDLFDFDTTPCQFSKALVCGMMQGTMGITAHASDNLELIVASILDAIQDVMTLDMLLEPLCTDEEQCVVTKVEFWGTTLKEVTDNVNTILIPPGDDDDDDDDTDGDGGIVNPGGDDDDDDTDGDGGIVNPGGDDDDDDDTDGDGGIVNPGGDDDDDTDGDGGVVNPGGDDDDDTDGDGSTVKPGGDGSTVNPGGDGSTVNPGGDGSTVNPGGGDDDDDDSETDGGTVNPGGDGTTVNPGGDGSTVNPGGGDDDDDDSETDGDGSIVNPGDDDDDDEDDGGSENSVPTVSPSPTRTASPSKSPAPSQSPAPSASAPPSMDRGVDGLIEDEEEDKDDSSPPLFLFAAVPLALLAALMLLVARNRDRNVMTAAQFEELDDYILPGTGDPPRSFHEGMYHYTRSGARYLSTNCKDCHDTRKMAMSHSFADLPPISENRLHDGTLSYSYDDLSSVDSEAVEVSAHDPSGHRKFFLVQPKENNLGQKASTVDVHQCSSATCRMCAYQPKDVCFIASPASPRGGNGDHGEDTAMSYLPAVYTTEDSSHTAKIFDTIGSQESI